MDPKRIAELSLGTDYTQNKLLVKCKDVGGWEGMGGGGGGGGEWGEGSFTIQCGGEICKQRGLYKPVVLFAGVATRDFI